MTKGLSLCGIVSLMGNIRDIFDEPTPRVNQSGPFKGSFIGDNGGLSLKKGTCFFSFFMSIFPWVYSDKNRFKEGGHGRKG